MYKISEFSKITNLPVKTLRYYDEEKILIPSYRDESNSYRYYDENDFHKAQLIILLRGLDFSIAEIKDVLSNLENEADLSYYLEEKKHQIMRNIKKERALIEKISLHTNLKKMEEIVMNYQVEIKEFAAITVASTRYKGKYSDMGKYIGTIYKAVKGNSDEPPISLYYDDAYEEEADIELCVPTKKLITDKGVTAKTLPAIKAICVTHKGSYDKLNLAYKALLDYASSKNLKLLTPSREVYIKVPACFFGEMKTNMSLRLLFHSKNKRNNMGIL